MEYFNYDDEPVHYCDRCLSLKVMYLDEDSDDTYCGDCGCTEIKETNIHVWKNMYKNKYKHNYLN